MNKFKFDFIGNPLFFAALLIYTGAVFTVVEEVQSFWVRLSIIVPLTILLLFGEDIQFYLIEKRTFDEE